MKEDAPRAETPVEGTAVVAVDPGFIDIVAIARAVIKVDSAGVKTLVGAKDRELAGVEVDDGQADRGRALDDGVQVAVRVVDLELGRVPGVPPPWGREGRAPALHDRADGASARLGGPLGVAHARDRHGHD